jgi:peptidoglycan hydrolase-like protein with peptidoglycan-binding domain
MMTRPAPRFAPTTMTSTHHFRRFHNRTFVFIDAFGFPVFYPYPGYGYYYGYDDYGYGGANIVVEVQQRLARAGYYHGPIDGIMGPQTRRAISAYERDHNMPALRRDRPAISRNTESRLICSGPPSGRTGVNSPGRIVLDPAKNTRWPVWILTPPAMCFIRPPPRKRAPVKVGREYFLAEATKNDPNP